MVTDESILQIAEQLGIATEHIYDVFVTAQPIIAIMQIACGIFVIGFLSLGYYLYYKYKWECDGFIVGFVFGMIGFIISIFVFETMKCLFLPEYSAIMKLMKLMIGV